MLQNTLLSYYYRKLDNRYLFCVEYCHLLNTERKNSNVGIMLQYIDFILDIHYDNEIINYLSYISDIKTPLGKLSKLSSESFNPTRNTDLNLMVENDVYSFMLNFNSILNSIHLYHTLHSFSRDISNDVDSLDSYKTNINTVITSESISIPDNYLNDMNTFKKNINYGYVKSLSKNIADFTINSIFVVYLDIRANKVKVNSPHYSKDNMDLYDLYIPLIKIRKLLYKVLTKKNLYKNKLYLEVLLKYSLSFDHISNIIDKCSLINLGDNLKKDYDLEDIKLIITKLLKELNDVNFLLNPENPVDNSTKSDKDLLNILANSI